MLQTLLLASFLQVQVAQDSVPLIDSNQVFESVYQLNEEGEYQESLDLLQSIPSSDSNYVASQAEVLSCLIQLDLDSAYQFGDSLMSARTDLTSLFYIRLGNAYLNNESLEKALEVYGKGRQFYPYDHSLIYNTGFGLYRQGKYEEAIGKFQEVLTLNPYYSSAHQVMGNILSQSNQRTKAVMSFLIYLAINPDQNWALVRINDLVSDAYREENNLSLSIDNELFQYYDDLMKSKAALDDRYQSKVDFEVPVAQQCELLINSLKYVSRTDDFWMNFYVPFLEKIAKEELTDAYVYFMLSSANKDEIDQWLEKHQKEKDAWIEIANEKLDANRKVNVRTVQDSTAQYSHWYYSDKSLQAIGNEDQEGNNVGPFEFYHPNGRLQAKGWYHKPGYKSGDWFYYYDDGQLKKEEHYNIDGELVGEVVNYSEEGDVVSKGSYEKGDIVDFWRWYHPCGALSEKYPYVDGVGTGQGEVYYETGELKVKYQVADGDLNGPYIRYYKNGQIDQEFIYSADVVEGAYKRYYPDGSTYEIGQYKTDEMNGPWEIYFDNGQLSARGAYKEGLKVGQWLYYYRNGELLKEQQYDEEGALDGQEAWYDIDGKLHSKRRFEKDALVEYAFYGKDGSLIYEASDPEGNMPYETYYASGKLLGKGRLTQGEINGPYTEYFPNGVIEEQGNMLDGKWHGAYQEFDENGNKVTDGYFEEGQLNGYYRNYYPNGNVKQEGWVKDGNIQQYWREFYSDGTIKALTAYEGGVELNGESKYYGPQGKLYSKDIYKDGTLIGFVKYDSLGKEVQTETIPRSGKAYKELRASGSVFKKSEKKCGIDVNEITYYNNSGRKSSEYSMEGSLLQKYTHYDYKGQVDVEGTYLDDERHGDWKYYYDNGQLESVDSYLNGNRQGKGVSYYRSGQVHVESEYYADDLVGARKYYGPSGALQLVKYYNVESEPYAYQYLTDQNTLCDSIFLDPQKDEEIKAFYADGQVSVVQQYKKGIYHGASQHYYENGQLYAVYRYEEGRSEGLTEKFWPSGKKMLEVPYHEDYKNGTEKMYHENGRLKEEVNWVNGNKQGWHKVYDGQGKLVYKTYYWNDVEY
ncbi:tetratricopeptide repeat protein [Reichenbachiella ulvae]|uniref:Tetratricopeptide repeat protein n=1 Tax=Reichenbachiella ulvae TaxID=2980104 RepID=A0ABT3CS17_9BACT|nr:tetratricopeptide repeat protein [Reichenbachiella ulvae]MCV9386348.1 tetratricopeptide repeat protein [Reichenbachiella ulvae]